VTSVRLPHSAHEKHEHHRDAGKRGKRLVVHADSPRGPADPFDRLWQPQRDDVCASTLTDR